MKKTIFSVTTVLVLLVGAAVWLNAAPPPTVGSLSAIPAYIVVNTPTAVIFSIQITDPTLMPNGVNLLRTDSAGKTLAVVGVMRDDGANGDAVPGDKVFSYRLVINESTQGPTHYQASAAFKGLLQRVKSVLSAVTVIPPIEAPTVFPTTLAPGKAILTARVTIPNRSQRPSVTIVSPTTPAFAPVELLDDGAQPDQNESDGTFTGWVPIAGSAGARIKLRASVGFPNAVTPILTPETEVQFVPAVGTAQGPIGVNGGVIAAGTGQLSFSVPPNAVTGPITFVISEKKYNELPPYIPASIVVRGAVEIAPDPVSEASDVDLTDGFNARVVTPLYGRHNPGSFLRVVYYNPDSKSLNDADAEASVGYDGLTASFTTKQIGLLLLIQ